MKANNDMSHLLTNCKEPASATIEVSCVKSSQKVPLLGETIDNDCSWTRTQNQLVRKRTLNHLAKPAK